MIEISFINSLVLHAELGADIALSIHDSDTAALVTQGISETPNNIERLAISVL